MVADISRRDSTTPNRPFKARVITSRYMSSSSTSSLSSPSSRRCPSPVVLRTGFTSMNAQKRSHSVERKHPASWIKYGGFVSNGVVAPPSVTSSSSSSSCFTSTRSSSVSFQGETFSLPVSKTKAFHPSSLNHNNPRKPSPERIRRNSSPLKVRKIENVDQAENFKLIDQHRWPGSRTRQVMISINSIDIAATAKEHKKLVPESEISNEKVSFDYCDELLVLNPLDVYDGCNGLGIGRRMTRLSDSIESSTSSANSVLTTFLSSSDTESISSASNSSSAKSLPSQDCRKFVPVIDARKIVSPKVNLLKKNTARDNPISSPRRVGIRSTSPSKRLNVTPPTVSSSSKTIPGPGSSPLRMRSSIPDNVTSDKLSKKMPSSFSSSSGIGGLGRGKVGANRIFDAHQLRLLYNRHLQWRFVNARSNAALYAQKLTSEKSIYTAWVATSELRCSVTLKKIQLHLLRHSMKLNYVLKGQMAYLEEWVHLERNHSNSVLGVVESIRACSLRLPIVCGAKVNIQNLKDAISSAVDVMQAMASSVCSLLSKVEEVNRLVVELANVSVLERALLNQCRDLLSTLSDMQVNDCSMRIQTLQLVRAYGQEG
ncbi:QWRF motif-containing protein 2-like [Papaver somniferum]|uniref:QWRF motif-containing protein 2-like n=1 Tax=Papaver somniferum TaxID=3469 RepID=UPI000E6F5691|nr:QWRF motif-containing protein 2-like [Papaver somniferum]